MKINKEMIFEQFKDVTKKDQSKKKETFTNRIEFLKTLKSDIQKNPKNFDFNVTPDQLQNTINCYLAPNPRDAFYKSVFGMTYAEKKQQEEMEYFIYEDGEKEKLENLKKKHNQYIKSLGIEIDVDSGEILQDRHGAPMPDYSCRPSLPTSDKISGTTYKKLYSNTIPEGKTISVPYNKGSLYDC